MNQVNCMIIDDEDLAIRLLKSYIEKVPYLHLAGAVKSGFDAIDLLHSKEVDLAFVDIEMPELTGMEFIKSLNRKPAFIFVTAYREYAADAFELDAVDYLLKPVSFERFLKSVNKYLKTDPDHAEALVSKALQLRADRKVHQVIIRDILYVEGLKDYVRIYLDSREILIFKETLTSLLNRLTPAGFIRCHKSYLVPVSKITAFNAEGIELGEKYIPIGRSYKEDVIKVLENRG